MRTIRTDLAVEAHEYYVGDGVDTPDGVQVKRENYDDTEVTVVKITNEQGAQLLHKKIGTYITIETSDVKHLSEVEIEQIEDVYKRQPYTYACMCSAIYYGISQGKKFVNDI